MNKLIHLQALLLKWFKHFNVRTFEQIRITSKSLCISNNIEGSSIYKLLYPLLKMGFVEFVGDEKYQVSPSVIIFYPKVSIAVGINLTDEQKEKLKDILYEEDLFGNIRFQINGNDIEPLCQNLNCHYQKYDNKDILIHFPKIRDILVNFEESYSVFDKVQFYNNNNHQWEKDQKQIGIFRRSSDSFIYYLRIEDKNFKIPINPEGWLLAECYQVSCEKCDFFCYDKATKILTINNVNLPILIERILRLSSLYETEAVTNRLDFQVCYPEISLATIRQLNRIFDTKAKIING